MGTDIEFYIERREGVEWISCDSWSRNPDPYSFLTGNEFIAETCWHDRNYDMFSILAGVRSTGDYISIAPARGLPDDMSEILTMRANETVGEGYGYSPSWLTLAEILTFDWDQKVTLEGYAHANHFHEWVCTGHRDAGLPPPDLFEIKEIKAGCPDHLLLNEEDILKRTEPIGNPYTIKDVACELRLKRKVEDALKNCFCYVAWTVTYRSRAENFFRYAVSEMKKQGVPEDVRCVFWFG